MEFYLWRVEPGTGQPRRVARVRLEAGAVAAVETDEADLRELVGAIAAYDELPLKQEQLVSGAFAMEERRVKRADPGYPAAFAALAARASGCDLSFTPELWG